MADQAFRAIDYRVMLTIASSFGLGAALQNTNVSALVGVALTEVGPHLGTLPLLALIFLATSLLSCIVSNAACAVLLSPVLKGVHIPGVSVRKILLVLMLGASSAFATPIGYQTNLMVLRPGKYRFADYLKLGGPLTALAAVTIATVAYLVPDEWIP